jgi:uncharacterized membrane protein YsdA (DUF1294 family)
MTFISYSAEQLVSYKRDTTPRQILYKAALFGTTMGILVSDQTFRKRTRPFITVTVSSLAISSTKTQGNHTIPVHTSCSE